MYSLQSSDAAKLNIRNVYIIVTSDKQKIAVVIIGGWS